MSARPPQLRPVTRARYAATIETHDGWWFHFAVRRRHGLGIPENELSLHRTLNGARRAAARWCKHNERHDGELIEELGRDDPVNPMPETAPDRVIAYGVRG